MAVWSVMPLLQVSVCPVLNMIEINPMLTSVLLVATMLKKQASYQLSSYPSNTTQRYAINNKGSKYQDFFQCPALRTKKNLAKYKNVTCLVDSSRCAANFFSCHKGFLYNNFQVVLFDKKTMLAHNDSCLI